MRVILFKVFMLYSVKGMTNFPSICLPVSVVIHWNNINHHDVESHWIQTSNVKLY